MSGTDDLRDLLVELWAERRGDVLAEVDRLDAVAAGLLTGTAAPDATDDGRRAAHRLAGSSGTFGFAAASEHAREAEGLLTTGADDPGTGARLAELAVTIRRELEGAPPAPPAPPDADDGNDGDDAEVAAGDAAPGPDARPAAGSTDALLLLDPDRAARGIDAAAAEGLRARAVTPDDPAATAGDAVLVADLELPGAAETAAASPGRVVVLAGPLQRDHPDTIDVPGLALVLPRDLPVDVVIREVRELVDRERLEGARVLAVADDPDVLEAIESTLAGAGARVLREEGEDPLAALDAARPELVALDAELRGHDVVALCRSIRATPRWAHLPVVVLTARVGDAAAALAAGAVDVVPRPVDPAVLLPRARLRIARARLAAAAAREDPGTGLAGRALLEAAVESALASGARAAVASLDAWRPGAGDPPRGARLEDALRAGADRLRRGPATVVARLGERRLASLWLGMDVGAAVDGAAAAARAMREAGAPSAQAGVAIAPADGDGYDPLVLVAERRAHEAPADALVAGPGQAAAADVDVTLIEDDPLLVSLLEHALTGRGLRVRSISDGTEAARVLGTEDAAGLGAVILLDWDLPGVDGLRLLGLMAARGVLHRSRVIMLTARGSEAEVVKALEAGAVDHVAKPFSVPVLLQRVRRALERGA